MYKLGTHLPVPMERQFGLHGLGGREAGRSSEGLSME